MKLVWEDVEDGKELKRLKPIIWNEIKINLKMFRILMRKIILHWKMGHHLNVSCQLPIITFEIHRHWSTISRYNNGNNNINTKRIGYMTNTGEIKFTIILSLNFMQNKKKIYIMQYTFLKIEKRLTTIYPNSANLI